jgi:hypothetical protein
VTVGDVLQAICQTLELRITQKDLKNGGETISARKFAMEFPGEQAGIAGRRAR